METESRETSRVFIRRKHSDVDRHMSKAERQSHFRGSLNHFIGLSSGFPLAIHPGSESTFSISQDPSMEKVMASHSSILAWKIPWMEEPGGLHSMGSQRVRYD